MLSTLFSKFFTSLSICLFLLAAIGTAIAQQPAITRMDGAGAGNTFLEITEDTRAQIMAGTFTGEINYLPEHGPVEIGLLGAGNAVPGTYELALFDDTPLNDELGPDIFWLLKNLNSGQEVSSLFSVNDMPEQEVPEFGLVVKVLQTLDAGQFGPNNGAIGAEVIYADASGPQWLEGIPDDWEPDVLNFVLNGPGGLGNSMDPNNDFSNLGNAFFYPYFLTNYQSSTGSPGEFEYISPSWQDGISDLVISEGALSKLNNVDLVFTSDKSKWSRCVIVEAAMREYFADGGLGLSTQEDISHDCEVENFDLRGAPSVSKEDADNDGLPDPDGEFDNDGDLKTGMGWFPGYAIDVETGRRLNVYFSENSTYTFDQDQALLDLYGIEPGDFDEIPNGRDMMWNPTDQAKVDAGDADGFPYQYYLGGQHFIYITDDSYDGCEYIYSRLKCDESILKKVNALKRTTWTSLPILSNGSSLLSYSEGLIPNDVIVKLRVDNPFQVETGTGAFNGYPAYQFEIMVSGISDENNAELDAVSLSPNPYSHSAKKSLQLIGLPDKCKLFIFNKEGKLLDKFDLENQGPEIEIPDRLPLGLSPGIYFLQVKTKEGERKVLRLVVI